MRLFLNYNTDYGQKEEAISGIGVFQILLYQVDKLQKQIYLDTLYLQAFKGNYRTCICQRELKHAQEFNKIKCRVTIDGYTDFIFINRFGNVQHQGTLNKALRRIIRECNEEQLKKKKNQVLLPKFSCHSLRHTFTTRLVESGVNIKVVQEVLGHADFDTTMNVYTHFRGN